MNFVPALARYMDELLGILEDFRPEQPCALLCNFDLGFASSFLVDSYVRVEMTAEAVCWPVCHRHLPCWEVLLNQARTPELGG